MQQLQLDVSKLESPEISPIAFGRAQMKNMLGTSPDESPVRGYRVQNSEGKTPK
jgi:hypothetical protein